MGVLVTLYGYDFLKHMYKISQIKASPEGKDLEISLTLERGSKNPQKLFQDLNLGSNLGLNSAREFEPYWSPLKKV